MGPVHAFPSTHVFLMMMHQMLAAAAARSKELEVWKATADALQQEVHKLRY